MLLLVVMLRHVGSALPCGHRSHGLHCDRVGGLVADLVLQCGCASGCLLPLVQFCCCGRLLLLLLLLQFLLLLLMLLLCLQGLLVSVHERVACCNSFRSV